MSDGNYNRNLLPYNNYRSGVTAGRAQMKHLALQTFEQWLANEYPEATAEEQHTRLLAFKNLLDAGR